MLKIILSAGHGVGKAHNRGSICSNEGDNNYYYSLILKEELETYQDIKVDLVRNNINDNPHITNRSAMGKGYDLYLSLHSNAPGGTNQNVRGTEIFDSVERPNKALATKLCEATATLFNHNNRGVKYREGQPGFNWYGELRFNEAKSSMIVENGFHTNPIDCNYYKNNHKKLAEIQANVIAEHYKLRKKIIKGTLILSKATATIKQMQEWAKSKKANKLFIDLAPTFYNVATKAGVNPVLVYAQSAKETGYMKFGGVLNASFNNPCGLKTTQGGGDKDPNAHHRFKTWAEGIQAQVDHLALYAGAVGYPKLKTPDPRHYPYLKGTAPTVESLSGKWAPDSMYGTDIVKMIKEVEATPIPIIPIDPYARDIKINLLGKIVAVKGSFKDDTNFINVKGEDVPIRDIFESMGLTVIWENNMVVIKQ